MKRPANAFPVLLSLGAVALTTTGLRVAGANPPTAGFLFLLIVLFSATSGGLAAGIVASIAATIAYNYFFFPPIHTFHIADAENWVALGAFLAVAVVASQLVTRARAEAEQARARATEVRTLYDLSIEIFLAASNVETVAGAASRALIATGAQQAGIVLFDEDGADRWLGQPPCDETVKARARSIRVHRQTLEFEVPARGRDFYVPLGSEDRWGVLVAVETKATRAAVESIAQLVSFAMEREELLGERAHLEALRESESMKTTLLRAVSHDLSTPLTAITVQVASLRRQLEGQPTSRTAALLAEEVARLKRRIDNLLSMARLETGSVVPHPEAIPPPDLFRAARESVGSADPSSPFDVRVAPGCPDVFADPSLALEIVVNLVENARRASPDGSVVELIAEPGPEGSETVRLGVLDHGAGFEQISDSPPRGIGLEIARRFAEASGGSVRIEPRPGGGTAAWTDLPAAASESETRVADSGHSRR